jgi:hypothetical protein
MIGGKDLYTTDTEPRGNWTVNGGITIINNGGESGEEILEKVEYAARRRRSRGGRTDVADVKAF